jgi:hypothetical protein
MDLSELMKGVVRTVKASVRPDGDTAKSEAVVVYLDIDFSQCTMNDVLAFASADRKIAWATTARKHFESLKPGQHIKVMASSPGTRSLEDVIASMSAAQIEELLARAKARTSAK